VVDPRDPFKGCWDRLDRAIAHREEAVKVWNDFLADHDSYDAGVYVDEVREGVARGSVRIWQTRDVPAILPILFGEYFYNLRAALDHAVYVTAIVDNGWPNEPPHKDVLQFPICATEDSWRKQAYHVRALSDRHRGWVEQVQPYQGGEDPRLRAIYWINELARLDRHRGLRVVGGFITEAKMHVRVDPGSTVEFDPVEAPGVFIDREDGAVIARFTVSPWSAGDEIAANPDVAITIEIEDFAIGRPPDAHWLRWALDKRLWLLETVIHSEVGRLEFDAMGTTRAKYLDTEWEGFTKPGVQPLG
jgi:hypothetical protein